MKLVLAENFPGEYCISVSWMLNRALRRGGAVVGFLHLRTKEAKLWIGPQGSNESQRKALTNPAQCSGAGQGARVLCIPPRPPHACDGRAGLGRGSRDAPQDQRPGTGPLLFKEKARSQESGQRRAHSRAGAACAF